MRRHYFFDEGGRLALAIVRIAVASSVLMVLAAIRSLPLTASYDPLGIWMLVPGRPPAIAIGVLWVIAWVSTIAMLVGFRARAATAISCFSSLALASLAFSTLPPVGRWSHGFNVVFLAHLALLGGRCGDTLSVDAFVRRVRRLPPLDVVRGYQWSLRLVQFAVALMFIGACSYKLVAGHGFGWACSDNLRHQLLVRYDLAGLERTAAAQWLIDDVWRYRGAAALNLISQMSPLAAVLMPRRPIVRAIVASLFVAETFAIDQVMALPNRHWFPLAAVFIDWDRLFVRAPPTLAPPVAPSRSARIFIAAFVAFDLVVTFVPRLDQKLGAYPFSSFPLFASVRAAEPWDRHLPYVVAGDHFVASPPDSTLDAQLDHAHRRLYRTRDPLVFEAVLRKVSADHGVGIRHYLALFVAPAYPARARFDRVPIAITAELTPSGFRSMLGQPPPGAALVYYVRGSAEPHPLLTSEPPPDAIYIVAIVDGEPWLVTSRE